MSDADKKGHGLFFIPFSDELTREQIDSIRREWNKFRAGCVMNTNLVLCPAQEMDIHVLTKDQFVFVTICDDYFTHEAMYSVAKALHEAGIKGIVCPLSADGDIDFMTANDALTLLRPIVDSMSDEELESAGLQRKPKQDVFDINRSFS